MKELSQKDIKTIIQLIFIKWGLFIFFIFLFFPFSIFIALFFRKKISKNFFSDLKKVGINNLSDIEWLVKNNMWEKKSRSANYRKKTIEQINSADKYSRDVQLELNKKLEKNRQLDQERIEKEESEKRKKILEQKLSQKSYTQKKEDNNYSYERKTHSSVKNNNFFWNSKKTKSFWSGKSIWDNYESVTERFSSNKK